MWYSIRLLTAAAMLCTANAAMAAVVTGSFSGTAYDGTDTSGVFGAAGADLTGSAITGTYRYDTDLLSQSVVGPVNTASGSPGALTASITIGGQSFMFTDATSSSVTLDASTGEFDISLANAAGDDYETLLFGFVPTTNELNGTDVAQAFSVSSFYSSLGSFLIADPVDQAGADFTLTAITQSVGSTPVPEPGTALLVVPALLSLAVSRRWAGRARRSVP